jgi:hypothetical protein
VVHENVLSDIDDPDLVVYAVWEPILRTDNEKASWNAKGLLPDSRVVNFWTPDTSVGEAFQTPIGLETEPAWDVYLVYSRTASWNDDLPPVPAFFMHRLSGRLPSELHLDGSALAEKIRRQPNTEQD